MKAAVVLAAFVLLASVAHAQATAEGNQVFLESNVQERPEIVSGPRLQYPDLLRQTGVQGRVVVQFIVDTLGRAEPASVKVIESTNRGFDQSAKSYILRAMFRPGRDHGKSVRVLMNVPVDFKITESRG